MILTFMNQIFKLKIMKKQRLIWKCENCSDIVISYNYLHHDMNWCDCGKSAVDFENGYTRCVGNPSFLSTKELIDNKWVKI